jgi:hypothetical protein
MIADPLAYFNRTERVIIGVDGDSMIDAMRATPPMSTLGTGVLPHGDPFAGYDRASDPAFVVATPAQIAPSAPTGVTVAAGADDRGSDATGRIMDFARREGEARRSRPVANPKKLAADHAKISKIRAKHPEMFDMACALASVDGGWRIETFDEPTTAGVLNALESLLRAEAERATIAAGNRDYQAVV